MLDRTDGVTASFLKELLRRAAVVAATASEAEPVAEPASTAEPAPLEVSAGMLDAALDDLLATRNAMTRRVLGTGSQTSAAPTDELEDGCDGEGDDDDDDDDDDLPTRQPVRPASARPGLAPRG